MTEQVQDVTNKTDAKEQALEAAKLLKEKVLDTVKSARGATQDEILKATSSTLKVVKPVIAGLLEDGIILVAKGEQRATKKADGKVGKPQPVYVEAGKENSFLEFPSLPKHAVMTLKSVLNIRPALNQRDTSSRLKKEHLNGVASATQHVFRIGVYADKTAALLDGNSRVAAYKAGQLFYKDNEKTPILVELYELENEEQEKALYHEFDSTFSVMSSRDLDFQAKAELGTAEAPKSKTMNKSIKSAVSFATGKAVKVGVGIYDDVKDEIVFLDKALYSYEPEKALDGAILSAMMKLVKDKGTGADMEDFIGDVLLSLTGGQGVITSPEATLKAWMKVNTNRTYGSARATTIYEALVEDLEAR